MKKKQAWDSKIDFFIAEAIKIGITYANRVKLIPYINPRKFRNYANMTEEDKLKAGIVYIEYYYKAIKYHISKKRTVEMEGFGAFTYNQNREIKRNIFVDVIQESGYERYSDIEDMELRKTIISVVRERQHAFFRKRLFARLAVEGKLNRTATNEEMELINPSINLSKLIEYVKQNNE